MNSTTIREIPSGLWAEIVNQADLELAADPDAPVAAFELDVARVGYWLEHRNKAVGGPRVGPGDLLVKQREGACWTFTVAGWQPLAPTGAEPPVSGVSESPMHSERFIDEYLHRDPAPRPREFVTLRQGELRPPLFGEWSERAVEARAGRRAFQAIGELHGDADLLERLAYHLADGEDVGNDSPFYETVTTTRTFARALRYAAALVHKHTTTRRAP